MNYAVIKNTDKKTNNPILNALISFVMLVSIIATGLVSYHLFREASYNTSAVFTVSAYLSMVLGIYALSLMNRKHTLK